MEVVGLSQEKIELISKIKQEEDWILQYRVDSYKKFCNLEMPSYGPNYEIDFDKIIYYKSRDEKIEKLRERNEKLILANGNLLKQIPAEGSEPVQKSEETKKKSSSFSEIFDAHGRFLH